MISPRIRVAETAGGAVKVFITWPGHPLATTVLHGGAHNIDHLGHTYERDIDRDAVEYQPAELARQPWSRSRS